MGILPPAPADTCIEERPSLALHLCDCLPPQAWPRAICSPPSPARALILRLPTTHPPCRGPLRLPLPRRRSVRVVGEPRRQGLQASVGTGYNDCYSLYVHLTVGPHWSCARLGWHMHAIWASLPLLQRRLHLRLRLWSALEPAQQPLQRRPQA